MWSCVLMRPGEITPVGQAIVVAPLAAALAAQSQPTHGMMPVASTSTWPPWRILPGASTVPPVMSCAARAGGDLADAARERRVHACGHSIATGPLPPVDGVMVQSFSQPSPATWLPSSHCSGACTMPSPQRPVFVELPQPTAKNVIATANPRRAEKCIGALDQISPGESSDGSANRRPFSAFLAGRRRADRGRRRLTRSANRSRRRGAEAGRGGRRRGRRPWS